MIKKYLGYVRRNCFFIMKKSVFFVILTILVIIIITIFIIFNYKNLKIGNNESNKSVKEVEEYILNIKSYKATMDVTTVSNKNKNKYILKQEHSSNNVDKQTVVKPENIEGTELVYRDGNLEIKSSKLNLSKIYSNYPYLSDNVMWLNVFLEDYKKNEAGTDIYEENEYIVMQVNKKSNEYLCVRKLYLEKGSGKPKKLVVQDNNKKDIIYILYTEISIN